MLRYLERGESREKAIIEDVLGDSFDGSAPRVYLLSVHSRQEAVQRARAVGLLAGSSRFR